MSYSSTAIITENESSTLKLKSVAPLADDAQMLDDELEVLNNDEQQKIVEIK